MSIACHMGSLLDFSWGCLSQCGFFSYIPAQLLFGCANTGTDKRFNNVGGTTFCLHFY